MPFLVLARKASQEGCREDRNSGPGGGKQVENVNWKPQKSLSERELGGESVATAETLRGGVHVLATRRGGCLGVQNTVALAANPPPSCNFGRKVLTLAINSLLKCHEGYMHPSPLLNASGMPSPPHEAVTAGTRTLLDRQSPPSLPFLPLLSLPF